MPGDRFIELAAAEERRVLDVLFRHASEAVTVQDQGGGLVYANDRAANLVGFERGTEMMAAPVSSIMADFEVVDESGRPLAGDDLPGRRVLAGEEMVAEQTIGYRRRGSNVVRWSRVRSSPIKDDSGRVVWAINYYLDVTEEMRRVEADALVDQISHMLGSLDVAENLETLAKIIVPRVANWFGVHLVDDQGLLVKAAAEYPRTPEAETLLALTEQDRMRLDSEQLQASVVRSGRREVVSLTDEVLAQAPPEVAAPVRSLGISSVVCLPLGPPERPIGTLTVARSGGLPDFDRVDLDLLDDIAHRAGIALVNARMYQQEYELSRLLSKGLTLGQLPAVPGLEMAARLRPLARPGDLGGDFYDAVTLPNGTAILVGDIEGKGVTAAATVGLVRHTFRATVGIDTSPAMVLGRINQALLAEESPQMCTLAYLLVASEGPGFKATIALAGHPSPMVVGSDGSVAATGTPCPPAGLLADIEPVPEEHLLEPGSRLVVYTDGFCARDRTPPETIAPFLPRVRDRSLGQALDHLLFLFDGEGNAVHDDIVLLGLEVV